MKKTINKTITEDIEIKLPYFCKNICHTYKIISEEECIQVTDLSGHHHIGIIHADIALQNDNEICTEQYFINQYNKVLSEIKQAINSVQ